MAGGEIGDESIFREEALDYLARRRGPGSVVHALPRWTKWAFWLVIGTVAAALGLAAMTPVNEVTIGPARVDLESREALVLLPAGQFEDLKPGIVLRLDSGNRSDEIVLESLGRVIDPTQVRIAFGRAAPRSIKIPGPAIVATASLPRNYPRGEGIIFGKVEGRIGRDRLLFVLVPSLKEVFE